MHGSSQTLSLSRSSRVALSHANAGSCGGGPLRIRTPGTFAFLPGEGEKGGRCGRAEQPLLAGLGPLDGVLVGLEISGQGFESLIEARRAVGLGCISNSTFGSEAARRSKARTTEEQRMWFDSGES